MVNRVCTIELKFARHILNTCEIILIVFICIVICCFKGSVDGNFFRTDPNLNNTSFLTEMPTNVTYNLSEINVFVCGF